MRTVGDHKSHGSLYDVLLWRHASICGSNTRLEFWSPPWASSDRTWVGQHREAARTITEGAAASPRRKKPAARGTRRG